MSEDVIRELARAKALFQLRAIEAIIYAGAIADTHAKRGDVKQAPSVMSGGGAEGNRPEDGPSIPIARGP